MKMEQPDLRKMTSVNELEVIEISAVPAKTVEFGTTAEQIQRTTRFKSNSYS